MDYIMFLYWMDSVVFQQQDLQLHIDSEPHQEMKFFHQKHTPLTPKQPIGFEPELTKLSEW